jgi:phage portal protein BeeE
MAGLNSLFIKSDPMIPGSSFTNRTANPFYLIGEGGLTWNNSYSDKSALTDFLEIPELNAILNIKANMAANGIRQVLNKADNKPAKNYDPNVRILRNPNWFQTEKELRKQANLFKYIFGNKYLYFLKPFGRNTVSAMFALPPNLVGIQELKEIPFFSAESLYNYYLLVNNKEIDLENENIIHLNDNNVKFDAQQSGNFLKGTSKQAALQTPLKNIRGAYEARNKLITNHGALGILTNDSKNADLGTVNLDTQEKADLQNDFRQYGITKNQWHVILTNMSLKWQQMSMNTKDLMLFEEVIEDTTKICDAHGIPYELLAKVKNDTFTNKAAAEKAAYQNTIIPESEEEDEALNKFFETDTKSWYIKTTFDHLPIFQDDVKEKATSNNINMAGVAKVLAMPITNDGKIFILTDTYGYSQETASSIVQPKVVEGAGIGTGENVQVQSLNGAQVTSMVTIVQGVNDGSIPRESAINILMTSFGLTRTQATSIVG